MRKSAGTSWNSTECLGISHVVDATSIAAELPQAHSVEKPSMSPPSNSSSTITECTVADCQCAFHPPELPLLEFRWYSVIVGTNPGVYQGHNRASELTNHVSGAAFYFFATEEEARLQFRRALEDGLVVKVIPSVRIMQTRQDLAQIPGFRSGDPMGPESGDWAVVIVGRTPGIFLSLPGSPALRANITHVKHAKVVYTKLRSAAVQDFLRNLDGGNVMSVRSDEQRVTLDESVL